VDLKTSGSTVWIDNYRCHFLNTKLTVQREILDAVTVTNEEITVTVIKVKATFDPLMVTPDKYLLNPILHEHSNLRGEAGNTPPLVSDGLRPLNLASLLVSGGEL